MRSQLAGRLSGTHRGTCLKPVDFSGRRDPCFEPTDLATFAYVERTGGHSRATWTSARSAVAPAKTSRWRRLRCEARPAPLRPRPTPTALRARRSGPRSRSPSDLSWCAALLHRNFALPKRSVPTYLPSLGLAMWSVMPLLPSSASIPSALTFKSNPPLGFSPRRSQSRAARQNASHRRGGTPYGCVSQRRSPLGGWTIEAPLFWSVPSSVAAVGSGDVRGA